MIADAADDVAAWEERIEGLLTIHTERAEPIDWRGMLERSSPVPPQLTMHRQEQAARALKVFKPGVLDFLRGGSARIRISLESALERAKEEDAAEFDAASKIHTTALKDWCADRELAERLFSGDANAINEVITEQQSLTEVAWIGSKLEYEIDDNQLHAKPHVFKDDIVPTIRRKQLASGKLSETQMPIAQFNELYQDYVCSVALKVAGDFFQILPLEEIYVTCMTEMINTATGHQEPTPILSVQFVRQTYKNLNLSNIDPSDSLKNFNHVMEFKKSKGFSRIKPILSEADSPPANPRA